MDDLLEALKALAEGKGDKTQAMKLLKEHAPTIHQGVFQEGHNVGYGKKAGELTETQSKLTDLISENTQLKKDLETARAQNPDVAKLQADAAAALADAAAKAKLERDALHAKLDDMTLKEARREIAAALEEVGVDREYAGTVLVHRDDVAQRIRVDPTTGKVQLYQAGGTIPIVSAGEKKPAQLLAEEIVVGVEPRWLTSGADRGSGHQQGGAGPAGTAQKLADEIRAAAKERASQGDAGNGGVPTGVAHLAVAK